MTLKLVDFENLAGAFTLAPTMEGFELKAIRRVTPFGLQNILNNSHYFSLHDAIKNQDIEVSSVPKSQAPLTPVHGVHLLTATPPCSGFSLLNTSKTDSRRGQYSTINGCMYEVIGFASRCTGSDGRPGPEIVSFESVQQAYKIGRDLMITLLNLLRGETGQDYTLYHVLLSGASVGAAQIRRRYFWVASRVPFGVMPPEIHKVATYEDAISDLEDAPLSWDWQPISAPATPWQHEWNIREPDITYVNAHNRHVNPYVGRMEALARGVTWGAGEEHKRIAKRYFREHGRLPDEWGDFDIERIDTGFHGTIRTRPNRSGYVITGAGGVNFLHYKHDRILTVRECARLMGFPDDWNWDPGSGSRAFLWLGKQLPIQNGRWIARWMRESLNGAPGGWRGEQLSDKEYVIDITNDFRKVYDERTGEQCDSRTKQHVEQMERRHIS